MTAVPEAIMRKLAELEAMASDSAALASAARQRSDFLESQLGDARRQHRVAMQQRASDAEVSAVASEITKLEVMQSQAAAQALERQDAAHSAAHVHARCAQWVGEKRLGRVLEPAPMPRAPKDPARAVQSLRADIIAVQQEAQKVALAPLPCSDLRKHVREHMTRLAALARPVIDPLSGELRLAGIVTPTFVLGALCAMAPGATQATLFAQIDKLPDVGLSATDKAAKLRELKTELDSLERQEESALIAAQASGHALARRPDASPAAILSVKVTKAVKAAEQVAA